MPLKPKKAKATEPLNVRVKPRTRRVLNKQAKSYGLEYNNQPSVSRLLDEIGDGNLVILQKQKFGIYEPMDGEYNVNFQITVQDYPGALAKVASMFSNWGVNIIGIETASPDEAGYFDIIVRLPESVDAADILRDFQRLTLSDIWEYAQEDIITTKRQDEKAPEDRSCEYKGENLVHRADCSVSIQVIADTRVGLLAEVALEVAKERINLLSVFREVNPGELSVIHLHLKWSTLEQVQRVIKAIKKISGVQEVCHTDVNEIIQRFHRIRLSELQRSSQLRK